MTCTHAHALVLTHRRGWKDSLFSLSQWGLIGLRWHGKFVNVREVFVYCYTHACTYTTLKPTAGSPRRPHTHTHSCNQDYWSLSHTYAYTLSGAIWGAALVAVCGISENTGGNCSELQRHAINLDGETWRQTESRDQGRRAMAFCSFDFYNVVAQTLWYISCGI